MFRSIRFRRIALSLITASLLIAGGSSTATAGDHYSYCPPKQCILVPYQVVVIRYDHCGHPYKTWETRYRKVCVSVPCKSYGY